MFERPRGGERSLLIHVHLLSDTAGPVMASALDDSRQEFEELCLSAGADVTGMVAVQRNSANAKYLIGKGKAEEVRELVESQGIELVIFSRTLSPAQERNLERLFQCRVLDRTGLILDIFAQRARSFEGKLQVELAQLKHLSTRLIRGWTHLERQKGGIGLRGPGETQLETDRRLIGQRIKRLGARLEKVRTQREQGRRARQKAETPTVALVGYTNAGKSTLFNQLTEETVYAADQLFATLDPTLRRLDLPGGVHVVLADTVGFIRELPHDLVAAFRSTLAETRDADLLLHVVDAAREDRDECIAQVGQVLEQIGVTDMPVLLVYNKCDLISHNPAVDRDAGGQASRVWLSAQSGEGLGLLREVLSENFRPLRQHGRLWLQPHEARLRAQLYACGAVLDETQDEQGNILLGLEISRRDLESLQLTQRFEQSGDGLPPLSAAG